MSSDVSVESKLRTNIQHRRAKNSFRDE